MPATASILGTLSCSATYGSSLSRKLNKNNWTDWVNRDIKEEDCYTYESQNKLYGRLEAEFIKYKIKALAKEPEVRPDRSSHITCIFNPD